MAVLKGQCVQINLVGLINHDARNAMSLRLGMVVRVIGEHLLQTAFIAETLLDYMSKAHNVSKVRSYIALT